MSCLRRIHVSCDTSACHRLQQNGSLTARSAGCPRYLVPPARPPGVGDPVGTVTVTRVPSPVLSRARPGRTGWPRWAWVRRAPMSSPSGRVRGAVRQPRLARRASACQPPNPLARLSGSPARTRARERPAPRVMILLSSRPASQSASLLAGVGLAAVPAVADVAAQQHHAEDQAGDLGGHGCEQATGQQRPVQGAVRFPVGTGSRAAHHDGRVIRSSMAERSPSTSYSVPAATASPGPEPSRRAVIPSPRTLRR